MTRHEKIGLMQKEKDIECYFKKGLCPKKIQKLLKRPGHLPPAKS